MDPDHWINLGGLIVAAGLAIKALIEYRSSIDERRRSLRWQQADMARQIIDAIRDDPHSAAALKMLDWSGIAYAKPDGNLTSCFTTEQRRRMLRIDNTIFDDETEADAVFIRDCFDRLFEDCCLVEAYIESGLVREKDLTAYFGHYMRLAAKPEEARVLDEFALHYGYDAFLLFRSRMCSDPRP